MTSIQEAIDAQTKSLIENEAADNQNATENFKKVKDDMHKMNTDIDDKIGVLSDDIDRKINAVATRIGELSTRMEGKIETMEDSILNEIRNIKRRTGWAGSKFW